MTSHDCVMKLRRLLHIKKIGHTGTLDPAVEGVLPICIGEATKIIPFLVHLNKEYIANIHLGISTTTEDSEGEIIVQKDVSTPPSYDEVETVVQQFKGTIQQTPPMYSAIKVKGKKLYEYARENKTVERPTREVTIHDIEVIRPENITVGHVFQMRVLCSRGTYIRTLCVDIGEKLGYPAHMSYLIRTKSDGFSLAETVTFETIEKAIQEENVVHLLHRVEKCVQEIDGIEVDEFNKGKVLQGQKFTLPNEIPRSNPFKMMYQNQLLAMYEIHPTKENEIKPVRVFNMYKE